MRNIININYTNQSLNGSYNSANDLSELMVCIAPSDLQLSNYKIEVTDIKDTIHISDILTPSNDGGSKNINYFIPLEYWKTTGVMKVRLLSDEFNSPYTLFTCTDIPEGCNAMCKYINGGFIFHINSNVNPIIDLLYPVGTIVINHDIKFDPNKIYAGTKWARIKGKMIIGVDENDIDFNSAGKDGGRKTHTHKHWQTFGIDGSNAFGTTGETMSRVIIANRNVLNGESVSNAHTRQEATYEETLDIMNPYTVKYIWQRLV